MRTTLFNNNRPFIRKMVRGSRHHTVAIDWVETRELPLEITAIICGPREAFFARESSATGRRRLRAKLVPGPAGRNPAAAKERLLEKLFLDELTEMYDAERRVLRASPRIARAANCPKVKKAILARLKETEGHVNKLEQFFQSFNQDPKGTMPDSSVGLRDKSGGSATNFKGWPAMNEAWSSATRKNEHHMNDPL